MRAARALLLAFASGSSTEDRASPCPTGFTMMHRSANHSVCEDLSRRAGSLLFIAADRAQSPIVINKTAEHMFNSGSSTSSHNHGAEGPAPPPDGSDPTLQAAMDETMPMVLDGGLDKDDPRNCAALKAAGLPCKTWSPTSGGGWGVHTFVGSRGSDTIASFDSLGSDTLEMGYPDMDPFPG